MISASEMPGATTARLAEPAMPMSRNAFMMPHTVPNSPTNGVTLAVVARNVTRRSRRVDSTVAARTSARESDSRLRTVGRAAGWRPRPRRRPHLLVDLVVAGLEDAHQRARRELRAHGVHLGELAALAEDVQECPGLGVGSAQGQALEDDDGPRNEREHDQQEQDAGRDRPDMPEVTADPPRERRTALGDGMNEGAGHRTSLNSVAESRCHNS